MREFINLGDLRDPAMPETNPALIDCRDWESPRTLRTARSTDRSMPAPGARRPRPRAGRRGGDPARNRAEFLIAYFGMMRAGLVAVPVNNKFPRETIAFVLEDAQVRLAFCDATRRALLPADMPVVDFDASRRRRLRGLPRPRRLRDRAPGAWRDGDGALHLGLDGPAQGRAAVARRPALGGAIARRRRQVTTGSACWWRRRSST